MTKKRPLILVTNDDGISAPGIAALSEVMKEFGDVAVIAPDKPQSGVGHAITINSTLRIIKTKFHDVPIEYSVTGTPVDCVKICISEILGRKPDLCVSGINHGSNISINVIYSGTMSAAIEGAIEGIPSIGFSLMHDSIDADFTASKEIVRKVSAQVLKCGLAKDMCLNVNIPRLNLPEIKGIKVCRQAKATWVEEFDKRKDPSGNIYYWLSGRLINNDTKKNDTDIWAVQNNYVSVVPVQYDLTGYSAIEALKKWDFQNGRSENKKSIINKKRK